MIELDLFKLHDETEDKSPFKWILVYGRELSAEVEKLLDILCLKFKRKDLDMLLISSLGISKATVIRLRRKNRKWYPLIFLQTLLKIWKETLYKTDENFVKMKDKLLLKVELIKCNNGFSKQVKAIKRLTPDLCKIAGAHAADGTLYGSLIRISDEDKQAVESFKKWIENTFEIKLSKVKPAKNGREWSLTFRNRIIAKYLSKFFHFPSGLKHTLLTNQI